MIVVGNSAVLGALILTKTPRKSRMNFFIMHLALAGKKYHQTFPVSGEILSRSRVVPGINVFQAFPLTGESGIKCRPDHPSTPPVFC